MGVAVIGGLLASTALSLFVVPVIFTITDDLQQKLRRVWTRPKKHDTSLAASHQPPTANRF
jgi:hypothetical protein